MRDVITFVSVLYKAYNIIYTHILHFCIAMRSFVLVTVDAYICSKLPLSNKSIVYVNPASPCYNTKL